MHPISDKELDKLFRQRFDEFEVEPSDAVWGKISDQLNDQKIGRKSYSSFWMAAAGIILVLSAALWLFRPVEVIKLQGVAQIKEESNLAAPVHEPAKETITTAPANDLDSKLSAAVGDTKVSEKNTEMSNAQIKVQEDVQPLVGKEVIIAAVNKDKAPLIQEPVSKPVISHADSFDKVGEGDVYARSLAKSEITEEIQTEAAVSTGQRKIKSIGGLVNFVIAKVDHREDKIIEFKDGDEGTELAGLNLGLVKFRSRK